MAQAFEDRELYRLIMEGRSEPLAAWADALRDRGHEVVHVREPGGTALGEAVREVVLGPDAMSPWAEAFLFALAVAVGLTPELLPMVVTVNLAKGALAMSRKKVIVKRLAAIESGEQTVIGVNAYTEGEPSPLSAAVPWFVETMRKTIGSPSGSVTNDATGTFASRSTCVKPEPAPTTGA